ncbi:MAG: hypothetical protein HFI70_04740 [Lachnospiraceae bacterium]|nr:hypothetical protein [Lachnospiraceae bacterium]
MNEFGKEFYKLYQETDDHDYFLHYFFLINGREFHIVEFVPVNSILNNCHKIAVEKARYTRDEGQDAKTREPARKVINQFKGIMAETAIHIFLNRECGFSLDCISRWDLVRPDFKSAENEYDIKVNEGGREFCIESRSSSSYRTSLEEFMQEYDIIGKYTNAVKRQEKKSDLYIRPVFQYENPNMTKKEYQKAVGDTYQDISENSLKLFLVAAAGKEEMYGSKGYYKNMGQGSTRYRCIKIRNAHDMDFIKTYIEDLLGSSETQ